MVDDHSDDKEATQQVDAQVPTVAVDVAWIGTVIEHRRGTGATARWQRHVIMAFVHVILLGQARFALEPLHDLPSAFVRQET
jgi:phage gp37-like protein